MTIMKFLRFGIITVLCLILASAFLYSQDAAPTGGGDSIGRPQATTTNEADFLGSISYEVIDMGMEERFKDEYQTIYKIYIDRFERAGEWRPEMPRDQGFVKAKELIGSRPKSKEELEGETRLPDDQIQRLPKYRNFKGKYDTEYFETRNIPESGIDPETGLTNRILGVRVDFIQRGFNYFTVKPPAPYYIEGEVKGFEVWVSGRNRRHQLYAMVRDIYGNQRVVKMGDLNFINWKRLAVKIPQSVIQSDFRFTDRRGLTFEGFLVKCDPRETYGQYYIYFDDLVAEINRFYEENQDDKNPLDVW
jgi:hypothetical protein